MEGQESGVGCGLAGLTCDSLSNVCSNVKRGPGPAPYRENTGRANVLFIISIDIT